MNLTNRQVINLIESSSNIINEIIFNLQSTNSTLSISLDLKSLNSVIYLLTPNVNFNKKRKINEFTNVKKSFIYQNLTSAQIQSNIDQVKNNLKNVIVRLTNEPIKNNLYNLNNIKLALETLSSDNSNSIHFMQLKTNYKYPPVIYVGKTIIDNQQLIQSKNNVSDLNFPVGIVVHKDMAVVRYSTFFDASALPELFTGLSQLNDDNVEQGDKNLIDKYNGCWWVDWGNDIFDSFGWFFIYDVETQKYYFPILSPRNQEDGIITTQNFSAFGRTFTISHGYSVQGIFKLDVQVYDNRPFRFGVYGNLGSDNGQISEDLIYNYSLNNTNLKLYYHKNQEIGNVNETLYIYTIPKVIEQNISPTYENYYNGDNMSLFTKEVINGVIIYFSKGTDVKEWIANDLTIL